MRFNVPALAYHKVAEIPPGIRHPENYVRPAQFRRQLASLQRARYSSITVSQYLAYRRGDGALPPRPVMITFDDGYMSNYEIALPIVLEHGFTATVFIPSRLIGSTNVWDDAEIQEPLLGIPQIRQLQKNGIEFQSHTRTHASLNAVDDATALDELRGSRCDLEDLLGAPVDVVAYPWSRYDTRVKQLAADAGYLGGVILRRRVNFDSTPLFELRRIGVSNTTSQARFVWDLMRLRWRGE
ncbi:MAG TPA: polysaccharide deacetylase family protein [Gemmatimonadaceae bacterium]|nr:polysaccharide deacetylase family protein [Gemmatimonadaceae bacterium]